MAAILLDGAALAQTLTEGHRRCIDALEANDIFPTLAVILVGYDPSSEVYVRNKQKAFEGVGMISGVIRLPFDTSQQALEGHIDCLNADDDVHGILVQLPLPAHLDARAALSRVSPRKDVDGFHPLNAGRLLAGDRALIPCTAKGILYMLKAAGVPLAGQRAVVVGRSNIVGKPVALLLLREDCTVTVCHSRTENLADITRQADILIAAVGKPRFITADMVKPGAAVIDVGINRVEGKLVGDVDFEAVREVAGWLSPVPGGVGRLTVAMLLENTLEAACAATR